MFLGALPYEYVQHLDLAGRERRTRRRPTGSRVRRDRWAGLAPSTAREDRTCDRDA